MVGGLRVLRHDSFGTEYASQVVGRAQGWELNGFCVNCPLDATLVALLDDAYGVDARRQLRAAERRKGKKHKKSKSDKANEQASERARRRTAPGAAEAEGEPATAQPAPAQTETTTTPQPWATTTTPATGEAPAQPVAPAPRASSCTKLKKLLGCRD